ncbi:MAG: cysteine hydrolase [Mesorhizobium sp.]|nr:MAG: cysteine hydrolase [Mesorhizobium sp.]RWL77941.1 MAG: cysteine hydrolase [Mesorhizobium sp.]RWL95316.1 MAG: cysteine hydrolase [Mesorhizobium sp.]
MGDGEAEMSDWFRVERSAVLAVDLQGENLPEGACTVENYQDVLSKARDVLAACRRTGFPIIYTRHWLDPRGIDTQRYESLDELGRPLNSVAGSPGAEISPEVAPKDGDIVIDKQRFTAFYGTKLDLILNRLDIEHLIIFGVWTEACLETTVWDALWRDFRITLVKDACGSATETMHKTAMLDMANWLRGGMIIGAEELVKALDGKDYRTWRFEKPFSMPYRTETIDSLYESL